MATSIEPESADLDKSSGGLSDSGMVDKQEMLSHLNRFGAEDWGSIADILKSMENTSQGRPARLSPQHHRLTPLSENIQCSVPPTPPLSPTESKPGGQGMQQLDHLLRLMEQMCALQKQNSKLREQAEYLTAIKNLQDLRNETLLENCYCDSQHRSSDPTGGVHFEPLQMPEETLSEPESQIGDDMNASRQRERRNSRARSIKREVKSRSLKKRSRSADPYSDGNKEPQRERVRPGIFSKIEKMKEKLTTRRASVKRHPPKGRNDDEVSRRLELSTDGSLQMDGTETKSEDSGIYHVDREDHIISRPEMLQKNQEEFSDSEEVFSTPPLAPSSWGKPGGAFTVVDGRKNSDFSTGSSSEDYLELKPKRHTHCTDSEGSVVYRRRRRDLSPHRLKNCQVEGEIKKKLVRRSASFQDNISLNSDDDYEDAKSQWESKEAPAVMQGHVTVHHSNSIPMTDHPHSRHYALYESSDSSDLKAAQKRKFLHRSNQVDEMDSSCNGEHRPHSADFLSLKNSPPDKKRTKGWEKVKHAVTRKHMPESGSKKGFSEFYMDLSAEDHAAFALAEGTVLSDGACRGQGSDHDRSGPRHVQNKRSKDISSQAGGSAGTSNSSLAMFESLQANLSDDFTKKMEKWDKKKTRRGGVQLERTKHASMDSASSDAASSVQTPSPGIVLDELQKNLSDEFTKKMMEWDRKKQRTPNAHSPPTESARKSRLKEKRVSRPSSNIIKNKQNVKGKESPQIRRRSQSPESRKTPYSTEEIYSKENMVLFERENGELLLEGVSKEFNKRYKEWEKMKKMAMVRQDDDPETHKHRAENESMDIKDFRRMAIIEQHKSTPSDLGDVYLVAHATPAVVEPDFDPTRFHSQETESQPNTRTPSSMGDNGVFEGAIPPDGAGGVQLGTGLNRLEQRNTLLARQLRHRDVNLLHVSDELQNMQEQIDRITGEKHEMRRVSACSSLGESALEAELTDVKSQIQILEDEFDTYLPPPKSKRQSQDEVRCHKRGSGSKRRGDIKSLRKVDESTSTEAIPEKIEVEVQTNDQSDKESDEKMDRGSPTTELKKCLHEREAIIKLLQAEVDRQALELDYLRSGDTAGPFRRAKSFSARDRKTFDMRAMRIVNISLNKTDKLEDLAEKADEIPELPTRRLDDYSVAHREKSDTLSSRSSQDSKRESLRSIQSSSTAPSLEALHISAEDIRMEESGGSEASDKPRSLRSQASDASSSETKSEPIRKLSLEKKGDRKERELSPESATSLLRRRCNQNSLEILPNRRDLSPRSDSKGEDVANYASSLRRGKVNPHIELVQLAKKPENQSTENGPQSPRRLTKVNRTPNSGSPVHVTKKWESLSDSNKGSSESLGSREGKSLVQERKEMFAIRGRLEKASSLDSTQITRKHSRNDIVTQKKLESAQRRDSSDSTSSSPHRKSVSQAWVEKHDPILSKSKKPQDKSVNNLRKKFSNMEFGSAPNVSEGGHQSLKDKYTPRVRREVPKQGCVRQLSQAFSMVSLMEGDKPRRGSQSSSVKSSPISLSPASSTNSLIASQIKKLQDKTSGSSSDVTSSRRQSVDVSKTSTRENSPAPGNSPLINKRENRQSLPNIAAARAKFDKSDNKPPTPGSDTNGGSGSAKPRRVRSTPAKRITYKVSVVNDEKKKTDQSASKDTKSEKSLRGKSPRLVAVIESPPEKEEEKTVTFTVNPNPSRGRQVNIKSVGSRSNGNNNSNGNVRRKTQMFIATVEETTTVIKKPKEQAKKDIPIKLKAISTGSQPKASESSSAVQTNKSDTSKSLKNKSGNEESVRGNRRRREPNNSSLTPADDKPVDNTTNKVQSTVRSPDARGRRSRNRRDMKSQDMDSKKPDTEKQDKPAARGPRRERRDTKTPQTEAQRKEAIIARRERREVRETANVERKDSKKDKSAEVLERKDSKNIKSDKKVGHVEIRDSTKSKKESVKVERKDSKTKKDVRLQRTESDLRNEKKDTDSPLRSLRRRKSKKDDLNTPSAELDSTSEGASGNSEIGDNTSQGSDYPDLLATTRRKNKDGSSRIDSKSRCARAVVAHSALKGAEALIGTQLPKTIEEEERKSSKDKSRRGRAINRADRISRLDLFRRARSVDSSKATKDRSPSKDRGKGDRAQSVDRTSKNRDSSVDRQKGDGKNWLSKRTGSITNFLRASNKESWDQVDNSRHDDDDSVQCDCNDNCHHDSCVRYKTLCDVILHYGSDGSDESETDSMFDSNTSGDSDTDVFSQ